MNALGGSNLYLQAFTECTVLTELCFQIFLSVVTVSVLLQLDLSDIFKTSGIFLYQLKTDNFSLQSTHLD